MFYDHKKVKGVPLEEGEHEFRLEARDKAGQVEDHRPSLESLFGANGESLQMASAPFKVSVTPSFPFNHIIHLELDTSLSRFSRPSALSAFVHQLASAFRSKPDAVTIRNITGNATKTQVAWSNNTVPHKVRSFARFFFAPVVDVKLWLSKSSTENLRLISIKSSL